MKRLTLSILFLLFSYGLLSQACGTVVVPPTMINGISVTATSSGSVSTFVTAFSSCGYTTPVNSIHLGQSGTFSYTFHFNMPVNNLIIIITAAGTNMNEVFTFNTNTGAPTITINGSCFTTVAGNVITSGFGAGTTGGGGMFTFTRPTPYSSLTITGPGGAAGSLFALCSNSVTPILLNYYDTICQGDSIYLSNAYQKTTGIYVDSFKTSTGVDSIVTTGLTIEKIPIFKLDGITNSCVNQLNIFKSPNSGVGNLSNFYWDFGDGNTATQFGGSISHIYTSSGLKTVSVTVTSNLGCSYDTTFTFDVKDIEAADFYGDSVCLDKNTSFFGLSNPTNVTSWDYLVEGINYSTANFSHIFATSGTKNIRLIITNAFGCSDTITKTTVVYPKPTASFNFSPSILTNLSSQACFNNYSTNAVSYFWDFKFSNSINSDPCVIYPTVAGIFPVKLIAISTFGCIDSLIQYIEFRDIPVIYIPNTFTPNDDGLNDDFTPIIKAAKSFDFYIFNSWGEQLFYSNDMTKGWDGKYKSELSKSGIYVYYVKIVLPDNSIKEYRGHVQLLK